ncbi:putative F-box/FBD/LRR-repeat protein At5g22610 [Henckelia pumila]|uniref:putative F-box/FBD/LRR-repeat protein At5g22610 n=1 Tax=Henckelia pumila TaxID=405737 RepID=UPI003C6E13FD
MEDRISHLPDHLLHDILSLLSNEAAAKTSILSKHWNSVWNSFPILVFDEYEFSKNHRKVKANFCDSVDRTIQRRYENSIFTERLDISIYHGGMGLKHLDSWIDCALTKLKLSHLIFVIRGNQIRNGDGQEYVLPQCVWNSQWLRVLKLTGCVFSGSINTIGIGFSLRKLSLESVRIDETTFHHMISSCFGLEDLQISECVGFKVLNVVGLKRIHTVGLFLLGDQSVFVESPGLQFLGFQGGSSNPERIIEACILKKLEKIHLFKTDISELDKFIAEFPWLENLWMSECKLKESFSVSSGSLMSFSLIYCDNVKHIVIDACCLKQFRYGGRNRLGITWVAASDKVEIHHIHGRISFDIIAMFLVNLPFSKSWTIIYDESSSNWIAPVPGKGFSLDIEQLRIKIMNWRGERSSILIVKELLRMGRRPSSALIELQNGKEEALASFMKIDFLHHPPGELDEGRRVIKRNCLCGDSSCWRCCLGEVHISRSLHAMSDRDERQLVDFLKGNALRLKKIIFVESKVDDIHSQEFDCCLAPQMKIKGPPRHLVFRFPSYMDYFNLYTLHCACKSEN